MIKFVKRSSRLILAMFLLLLLICPALRADKKSAERLIELTKDGIPGIREAASKALVAGYIIAERPLSELERPAAEAIDPRGFYELKDALEAAGEGEYIDACYRPQEVEDYTVKGRRLLAMSVEELEHLIVYENVAQEVKEAAAILLVQRAIESVGVEFSSFYIFRHGNKDEHEEEFDEVKNEWLEHWLSDYSFRPDSVGQGIKAACVEPLAKMYLAEHLVYLDVNHLVTPKIFNKEEVVCPLD